MGGAVTAPKPNPSQGNGGGGRLGRPKVPHHDPPGNGSRRNPAPKPKLKPDPIVLKALKHLRDQRRKECELGHTYRAKKKFPKNSKKSDSEKKRQRPCKSGKPIITYTSRTRKIGRFNYPNDSVQYKWQQAFGPGTEADDPEFPKRDEHPRDFVIRRTREIGKEAGYERAFSNTTATVYSEESPPETIGEAFDHYTIPGGVCYYNVFVQEQRRHCKCPDGSPCRKTRI